MRAFGRTAVRRARTPALLLLLFASAARAVQGAAVDATSSSPSGAPSCGAGTVGTVEYNRGSLPPPYYYSWHLEFHDDSGVMTLQGGYQDDPDARWTERFPLTADRAGQLCRLVAEAVAAGPAESAENQPGSSSTRVELIHPAGGTVVQELPDVPELAGSVIDLLPEGVWSRLHAHFETWSDEQER